MFIINCEFSVIHQHIERDNIPAMKIVPEMTATKPIVLRDFSPGIPIWKVAAAIAFDLYRY